MPDRVLYLQQVPGADYLITGGRHDARHSPSIYWLPAPPLLAGGLPWRGRRLCRRWRGVFGPETSRALQR